MIILDRTAMCSILRSTISRYSSTYVNSIFIFLSFGRICCLTMQEEKDIDPGDVNWERGVGGMSTGPSLETDSNLEVGDIEVESWLTMESIILGILDLDLRKVVILFIFLNCLERLLYNVDLPIVNRTSRQGVQLQQEIHATKSPRGIWKVKGCCW